MYAVFIFIPKRSVLGEKHVEIPLSNDEYSKYCPINFEAKTGNFKT